LNGPAEVIIESPSFVPNPVISSPEHVDVGRRDLVTTVDSYKRERGGFGPSSSGPGVQVKSCIKRFQTM
jgi:hypothetical protein